METKRLYLGEDSQKSITTAAQILVDGGVVAIPTETVYGLAASALNSDAIKSVFSAKGRPQDNPLIVHIDSIEMLEKVAKNIPEEAYICAERFWPGPLTMVLDSKGYVCKEVSAGLDTVAVRMPAEKTARAIIAKAGIPLAAPSANISGSPSPTTAQHVLDDLDGKIDAVVMGENSQVGVESTVISVDKTGARLLRPGAVTVEQLKEIFSDIIIDKAILSEPEQEEKVASPGMKYKHYAPKTQLFLIEGSSEAYCNYVNYDTCVAVCFEEDAKQIKGKVFVYGQESDPDSMAHRLFSILRQLDEKKIEKAYVHAPEKSGVGLAVYNRLIRACGFRVVKL